MMTYMMNQNQQSVNLRGIETLYEYRSGLCCRTHFDV